MLYYHAVIRTKIVTLKVRSVWPIRLSRFRVSIFASNRFGTSVGQELPFFDVIGQQEDFSFGLFDCSSYRSLNRFFGI
jgi:hypothetical protein